MHKIGTIYSWMCMPSSQVAIGNHRYRDHKPPYKVYNHGYIPAIIPAAHPSTFDWSILVERRSGASWPSRKKSTALAAGLPRPNPSLVVGWAVDLLFCRRMVWKLVDSKTRVEQREWQQQYWTTIRIKQMQKRTHRTRRTTTRVTTIHWLYKPFATISDQQPHLPFTINQSILNNPLTLLVYHYH